MNAPSQTKIFGIKVGVDPKWIVGGLLLVAVVFYLINTHTDSGTSAPVVSGFHALPTAPTTLGRSSRTQRRNRSAAADRGTLRIRPVDPTRGDVDPTLRLDMLARLQNVPLGAIGRSVFELQSAPAPSLAAIQQLNKKIVPAPLPVPSAALPSVPTTPQVNIPLRFYGFSNPAAGGQSKQGLFLDGDNVVMASEGELVDHRYLVVELTPSSAKLEDTQLKQGQTLAVVPEAKQP